MFIDSCNQGREKSMTYPHIEFSLTEAERARLHEAIRLIREVVKSIDEYYREDERLDSVSLDKGSTSVLRLVAMVIEDELKKHTYMHREFQNLLQ
jgi:hypothetical protein